MSSPLQDRAEAALADLRRQQEKIMAFGTAMADRTTSVTSKNRMVTVTVDSQSRLVGMSFNGTRYRNLAPAELAALVVETAVQAQETASREAMSAMAELVPGAFELAGLTSGEFDADAMFDAAVRLAEQPVFADDAVRSRPADGAGRTE